MSAEAIIQFLKIFGLIVFDMFFLIMMIFGIYLFFVVNQLKKSMVVLQDQVKKLVATLEDDTYELVDALKFKIDTINSKKIMLGSTFLSSLFVLLNKGIFRKNKKMGIVKSIIDIFL
jgi:hypothetical protein